MSIKKRTRETIAEEDRRKNPRERGGGVLGLALKRKEENNWELSEGLEDLSFVKLRPCHLISLQLTCLFKLGKDRLTTCCK